MKTQLPAPNLDFALLTSDAVRQFSRATDAIPAESPRAQPRLSPLRRMHVALDTTLDRTIRASGYPRELFPAARPIPGDVTEAQLLARARAGDEQSFAELFALHQRPIYRYAVHMCGADTADDIVQDTFMALLTHNQTFDATRGPLGAYLFGIARHVVLKRLGCRYSATTDDLESIGAPIAPDLSALDLLSRQETITAVRSAIAELPPVYREAIVLCDLQELDYQAAAMVLECPLGTVRSRLHRARALLATRLSMLRPMKQLS